MKNRICTAIFCICLVIFMLTFAIALPIYCRFFYYIQIKTLHMEAETGWDFATIKTAYNEVLDFCTLPWVKNFSAGSLAFSADGAAHFADCKALFILDFCAALCTAVALITLIILNKLRIIKILSFKGHHAYFYSAIVALALPLLLAAIISIDFDRAFQIFHAIFFPGKTNWVFDPYKDQIIQVMPQEFFMNCAIIIGVALVAFAAALIAADLILYYKKKKAMVNKSFTIKKLNLKKLDNTRDLGGLPTTDGKRIKYGKLIRSGKLYNLPESTVKKLQDVGVTTVVDMRIEQEKKEYPATPINGVEYIELPLVCTATTGVTHEKSMRKVMLAESKRIKEEFGTADNYMKSVYDIILFEEESKAQIRKFFDLVINNEGCILWNCSAGKDRTGIVAMLLEGLLGVEENLIVADYVISGKFQKRKRQVQSFALFIMPISVKFKSILYAFMFAKPQYITGAIEEIKKRYSSIEGYCKEALEITDEEIKILKDKYLE